MESVAKGNPLRWICLKTDMFDNPKIRLIEALPDADALLVCWVKLICLAGKANVNGWVMLTSKVPFTDEMLAQVFGRPVNTVRLALSTFERYGMIEVEQGRGAIKLNGWEKHQNHTGLERSKEKTRERVAAHRTRRRLQLLAGNGPSAPANEASAEAEEKWGATLGALTATGKLPALTIEHLARIDQEFPRARLRENFAEVVEEAQGVVGVVGATLPWLRKVVSRLEERVVVRSPRHASSREVYVPLANRTDQ